MYIESGELKHLIDQRKDYRMAKTNFIQQYETLSKYYYQVKKDENAYTSMTFQGSYLNDGSITENVGALSAQAMASAVMGAVWKAEGGTFILEPPKGMPLTKAVKDYYVWLNDQVTMFMERRKAKYVQSLSGAVLEAIIYGTGGAVVHQGDYSVPLKFIDKSAMFFYIGYNADGEIDTIVVDHHRTARELVLKYGEDKVGGNVRSAYRREDQNTRFTMSQTITPRKNPKADVGKLSMPYASYIYLPDENVFLEEGGFESLPLKVLFYRKLEYESYGRGPGMDALPTVVQANVANEILSLAGEQIAQPTLGMFDDGSLAGKVVDLSAGALNVFNVTGAPIADKPIFPIYTVGDISVIFEWWKILVERVGQFFLLDKLYDLNSEQRMTLGESLIRNGIRSDALAALFSRVMHFIEETIDRSIDILYAMGLVGVSDAEDPTDPLVQTLLENGHIPRTIPAEVLDYMTRGVDWYVTKFISPAARLMRNDELQSVTTFISLISQAAQLDPQFLDSLDTDGTVEKIRDILSADLVMLKTPDEVAVLRENRRQMQMKAMEIEAARVQSQTNQSNAQAAAAQSGAINNMMNQGGENAGQF